MKLASERAGLILTVLRFLQNIQICAPSLRTLRAKADLYLSMMYVEAEDFHASAWCGFLSDVQPKATLNLQGKRSDRKMLSYRDSKMEAVEVTVTDLGNLRGHWNKLLSSSHEHDLSSLLKDAQDAGILETLQTALSSVNSVVLLTPGNCGECDTLDKAVRSGHLNCLQHLLQNGATTSTEADLSPLHLAVLKAGQRKDPLGSLYDKIAKLLVANHCDPVRQSANGVTPLHFAAGYGRSSLVQEMLHLVGTGTVLQDTKRIYAPAELQRMGTAADVRDEKGRTALFRALTHSHLEVARWLLQLRADANISDSSSTSPLHMALQRPGQPELAELLLESRAKVDASDGQQRTPLHLIAGLRKQGETARKLAILVLERECQIDPLCTREDLDGWTPVHEAALSGNLEVLELIIQNQCEAGGAEIDALKLSRPPDLLHLAVMGKNSACVEALLHARARPDQESVITWDWEKFRIAHHHNKIGLGLMGSGILAMPFDRIPFNTNVSRAEFSRNVSKCLHEFNSNKNRCELKVLNTKDLSQDFCDIIFDQAQRLDLRCIGPGEYKKDGSRRPLIVYKEQTDSIHTRRVLEDLEFRQGVRARLSELPAGGEEEFKGENMSSLQRKIVHDTAKKLGLRSKAIEHTVFVSALCPEDHRERRQPAENDDVFMEELRADLERLEPGEEVILGVNLSSYKHMLVHEEVRRRGSGWTSKASGRGIMVRRPGEDAEEEPETPSKSNSKEVEDWVRQELSTLRPGESYKFPATLNSFERRVVHEVAESLGWHQETVNVPAVSKGKGKGKSKAKGKGKNGKGRIPRQVTVTHKPAIAGPKPDWSKEVETELEKMILDPSLQECPFPWSEQQCQEGERKRRAVREVVTRFPDLLAKDEREGSKLRVVVRRAREAPTSRNSESPLPSDRIDCMHVVRQQLYVFMNSQENEYWYPPGLTKLHLSVIRDAAREFGLECQRTVCRPEDSQVLLRKGALGNPSETPVVHAGILCDGCNCVPQGIRYHCRDCDDFDFCETCHSKWQCGDLCHPQEHLFDAMSFAVQPRRIVLASVMNAFQLAAGLGLTKTVELMFQHSDADTLLQSVTNQGHSSLHLACQRRRLPMLEVLLEARADCNVKNGKGRSALDCAARLPSYMKDDKEELTDIVRTLLNAQADPTVVAENGDSPVHQAVGHNNWPMTQALLQARADPNAHGLRGRTALHMAAHTGRDIIARRLLEARADPTIRSAETGKTAEEEALLKEKNAVAREIGKFDRRSVCAAGPPLAIQRKQSSGSSASTAATEGYLPAEIRPQSMEQLGTGAAPVSPKEVAEAEASGPPRHPALHCEGTLALRHALLVCNSYKEDETQGDLSNAVPTGRKLKDALLRAGFKVRLSEDADGTVFEEQVSALVCELQSQPEEEHLVVFYFAGHGAEVEADLMMRMQSDASGGFPLRAVLERILTSVPKVGVVALPDCCRENSEDRTFRASTAEAQMAQALKAKGTSSSSVDMAGNFYVVWAGDRGTCIEDRCEDNLGFQLASVLKESRGAMLDEILQLACDQVRRRTGNATKGVVSQLQRPWIQRGDGQNLAQHVLRPILCFRCQDFRRGKEQPQDMHQASRILTAEGFAKILESRSPCASGASKELCALAALNALEARQLEDPHPEALSAFFCAAARANAVPVLRFMLHLHPELIGHLGYDAFDYASHCLGGRPTASAARRTPVLAVAASAGRSQEALEFLLVARADVAARDVEEWTAHHHASYFGAYASLATLLHSSGSAPSAEAWALTPLHLAASAGHADCVRLLLQHGASPEEAAPQGWWPSELEKVIHADPKAVQYQHVTLEQLGRSQMGKPLGGLRALHLAAAAGHRDCVEALLKSRADANASTERDLTALLLCLKQWHLPLGNPKKLGGKRLRNEHKDHAGSFDALLAAGARDILQDGCETGLHAVALHWSSVDPVDARRVAFELIDKAQSSIHARARGGGTPLHWAVNGRNWALCSLLLERRADPSIRNDMERAVWELPILEEPGRWRNADGELCRKKLKELRGPAQGSFA
ncbi:ANK2 [Symbiodinium sp. CCMP2592]|nr:ANK2 [Symbiodinium sp. CCMP2592]